MKCTECHREVKPVVAFDIDGTLGEYHAHLQEFMQRYFDKTLPDYWDGEGDWEEYLGLTREEYRDAKLAFRQGGLKRWMPVIEGMGLLPFAAHEMGAEVWITTTRPYNRLDSVDPDTTHWLNRNGVYYDHLLYDEHKYAKLHAAVGEGRVVAVVEDLPEQIGWAASLFGRTVPILMARQHNRRFRELMGDNFTVMDTAERTTVAVEARIQEWSINDH